MDTKILLVENDTAVRKTLAAVLGRFGFAVTTASTAAEAVDALAGRTFEAVVTDYRLREQTGEDVIRAVWEMQGETPVVLITGLADELPATLRSGLAEVRVLSKPFTPGQLRCELAEAIRGTPVALA